MWSVFFSLILLPWGHFMFVFFNSYWYLDACSIIPTDMFSFFFMLCSFLIVFIYFFLTFNPSSSITHAHTLTDAHIHSCVSGHLLWICTSPAVLAQCLNLLMQGNQLSRDKEGVTPQPQSQSQSPSLSYQTPTHSDWLVLTPPDECVLSNECLCLFVHVYILLLAFFF